MLDPGMRRALTEMFGARVRFDEPLSAHTSMRVGGPADALVEIGGEEELETLLALCASRRFPFLALGGGTNLIVRDGGFRGIAARLGGRLAEMEFGERGARAGGGTPLGAVVSEALRRGLAGLERLAGIPGTVGGAVRMNVGACGAEIGQAVAWARLVGSGGARRVEGREMGFEYRGCAAAGSAVVAEVGLSLAQGDPESLRAAAGECLNRRAEWLPGEPNAGCIFKNPAGGPSAGELIDRCGLKGAHAGGAAVHARHANVIVNRGNATAADVLVIMQRMRAAVSEETGILLDPEVVVAGEDNAHGSAKGARG